MAADVDRDGDLDIIVASLHDDTVAWYENRTIHRGALMPRQSVITTLADQARTVDLADLDGDGDLDALVAADNDDEVAWYENTDGLGAFGPQRLIDADGDGSEAAVAVDLDGDGDPDVLSASTNNDRLYWYKNHDGAGSFGGQRLIARVKTPRSVYAADLDGDGDLDVLSSAYFDHELYWLENTDGEGMFGPKQLISSSLTFPRALTAADVDGGGDQDVLSTYEDDDAIAWFENTGQEHRKKEEGTMSTVRLIPGEEAVGRVKEI